MQDIGPGVLPEEGFGLVGNFDDDGAFRPLLAQFGHGGGRRFVSKKGAVFGKDEQGFREAQAMRAGAGAEHGFHGRQLGAGEVLACANHAGRGVAAAGGGDDVGGAGGDAGKVFHQRLRGFPDDVQAGSLTFEAQDFSAGSEPGAAGDERPDAVQATQFAHAAGFFAAADNHVVTGAENERSRLVADAERKSGGVATGCVFEKKGVEGLIGQGVGRHARFQKRAPVRKRAQVGSG